MAFFIKSSNTALPLIKLCKGGLRHSSHKIVNISNLVNDTPALHSKIKLLDKLKDDQWKNMRNELLQLHPHITEHNVDTIVMDICFLEKKNIEAAKSYVHFLKNNNFDVNLATIKKYISIFKCNNITDIDKNNILALCKHIKTKYPVLDTQTKIYYILGICMTDDWKNVKEMIDGEPTSIAIWYWISAAFRNKRPDIGWEYLEKKIQNDNNIPNFVHESYITFCLDTYKNKSDLTREVLKFLQFLQDNNVVMFMNAVDTYIKTFALIDWIGTKVFINENGRCPTCKQVLNKRPKLVQEDYNKLSHALLQNVIIGNDLYEKTTPEELQRFQKFIQKTKPYDIVIDGLNVAYTTNLKQRKYDILKLVVQHFVEKKQSILFFGRKHMVKWKNMDYISKHAHCFFADNLSKDDPYLLYAALSSGLNTQFISKDLMRSHKYLLRDRQLCALFKNWQISHQLHIQTVDFNKGKVYFKKVSTFEQNLYEGCNGWHLPYILSNGPTRPDSYEALNTWICLQKPVNK